MILARIGREYLGQMFAFVVSLADRLLTAGILIRYWGADAFSDWTVAVSAAGLIVLLDFGFNAYLPNRLMATVGRGEAERAEHVFSAGNAAILCASLVGFVFVCLVFATSGVAPSSSLARRELFEVVAVLTLAAAARQSTAMLVSVYRAHRDFFRETIVLAIGDAMRIAVLLVGVVSGLALTSIVWWYLAVTVLLLVAIPMVDVARRYPGFRYRLSLPDAIERRAALRLASQYWMQSGVNALLLYAPVFFLAGAGAAGATVAQFALMRTLSNFVRSVLQLFATVLGMESGRRMLIGDLDGLAKSYRESTIFMAVQTWIVGAVLVVLAKDLFVLWTGNGKLFDPMLLLLAIAPPLLLPTLPIAIQFAATSNTPQALLRARLAQLIVTVILYVALPFGDASLRMMVALGVGEVVAFGLSLMISVAAIVPQSGWRLQRTLLWRSAVAGSIVLLATYGATQLLPGSALSRVIAGLCAGGATGLIVTALLGFEAARRRALITQARAVVARSRP